MNIISNTTVISNFAAIDQLAILQRLYPQLYISTDVYAEIQQGLEEGYTFYEGIEAFLVPLHASGWIHLTGLQDEDELRYLASVPKRLHKGEASCLAIAKGRGWLILTDDLSAREEAQRLDIPVSGSLGCLVLAVERGLCSLDTANTWLLEMLREGYHSPLTDLTPLRHKPSIYS